MEPQPRAETAYRLSTARVIRIVAPFEVLIGLAWIVTALAGPPRAWTVALAMVTVAVAVVGAYLFARPPRVLTLTADGFRIGLARGAGRTEAAWRDVESVATTDAGGVPVLVFLLADGGRSALPVSLLGSRKGEAQREVHERLNSAYGYRRF